MDARFQRSRGWVWQDGQVAETSVAAHPVQPWIAITDGHGVVLVDATGKTVWSRPGVRVALTARF